MNQFKILSVILLTCISTSIFSEEKPGSEKVVERYTPSQFEFGVGVKSGFLFGGGQFDFANGLEPNPYLYQTATGGLNALGFLNEMLGLEASYHWGITMGNFSPSANTTDPYIFLYNYSIFSAGLVVRFFIPLGTTASRLYVAVSAGINRTSLELNSEFKNVITQSTSVSLNNNRATGTGFYISAVGRIYFTENLFGSYGLEFSFDNPKYSGASEAIDGYHFRIPLGIGVYF